jgi:phospholipid/cholesterol/gamma-HCH transport system ATP-binding protein
MIELKNVSKSFDSNQVLKNISATFKPGITNMIIGGSGSGKTTLLKCMIGLHEIDAGEINYDGVDFSKLDFKEKIPIRKEIGMLFQSAALFDSMNVEDNILFPLNMFSDFTKEEKLDRINFCLKRVNLENVNQLKIADLSGGMKKRVGIARAIAMQPKYLFCDEPNSGLDPRTSIIIDNLIREITLEYQITTIVNSHDMNSVMEIGDHIIFLHQGQNWWEGSNTELIKSDNQEVNEFVFASKLMKSKYQ